MPTETITHAKRSRTNTRARLLEAAATLFSEMGFQAATVEDVCAAAGFTRGAFYSNFESLDELFLTLWDEWADAIVASVRGHVAVVSESASPFDAVLDALVDLELYDRRPVRTRSRRHPARMLRRPR